MSLKKVANFYSIIKIKSLKKVGTTTAVHTNLFSNCVTSITTIASENNNQAITALTISILTQKSSNGF